MWEKILFNMNSVTKKWVILKISSAILIPLMFWFILNLISFYDSEYVEVLGFFSKKSSQIFFSLFLIFAFLFSGLTVSEIFEDYIHDEKIKNVANKVLYIFTIIIPIITILCIYKISL